jgi:hypothetical protein
MSTSTNEGGSVTEYGVQTPTSSTVLVVTADRGEAERALEWITDGRVVHRMVTYGGWQAKDDNGDLALAG